DPMAGCHVAIAPAPKCRISSVRASTDQKRICIMELLSSAAANSNGNINFGQTLELSSARSFQLTPVCSFEARIKLFFKVKLLINSRSRHIVLHCNVCSVQFFNVCPG
ncbi:hypothetical protein CEXT_189291, partial [Caerostris extrusa]